VSACCSTYGDVAGAHFDEKIARRDLESYRRNGPGRTARLLRDLLSDAGGIDGTLLDIGSGIGGLTFELLDRGVTRAIAVDASPAYLAAAAQEATRRDRLRVVEFVQGDFVDVGSKIPSATMVTMDRVICCYPSFEPLLKESLGHAERCFACSYPRDVWYVRAAIVFENRVRSLKKNPFRAFVHPVDPMTEVIERSGFRLAARRQTWQWSADVWVR
jgi:SAM-dependent methyltransferase